MEEITVMPGVTHRVRTPFGAIDISVSPEGVQIRDDGGVRYLPAGDEKDSDRRMFERLIDFHEQSADMLKRRMESDR